ncbi:glutaredoxin family protein [bacterium]|jgi:glutaredoxin|nr:glutaredoxin family protein [bacterium]
MSRRLVASISTVAVLIGCLGLVLLIEAQLGTFTGSLSYPLREHAPIWGMTFAGMVGIGIWTLWDLAHHQTSWRPTYPGRRFQNVVMYTRDGCPLCDEAAELLAAYRRWLPPLTEVDIDLDHELKTRLGEEIPVVQMDGKTRFKGHVNETLLRRLIEGTPPLQ